MNTYSTAVILSLFISGCTISHHVTPDPYTYPLDPIIDFNTNSSLRIVNSQQDNTEQVFLANGPNKWYANYQQWTDTAIKIMAKELTQRGVIISEDSERSVELLIRDAKTDIGFVKVTHSVELDVKLGNGYTASYTGVNSNVMAGVYKQQYDGLVMRAVAAMLNDPIVIDYFSGKKSILEK